MLLTEFDEKKYIKMERQDAELGISKEEIINQVVSKFDVTKEQALEYIDKYDKVFRN